MKALEESATTARLSVPDERDYFYSLNLSHDFKSGKAETAFPNLFEISFAICNHYVLPEFECSTRTFFWETGLS